MKLDTAVLSCKLFCLRLSDKMVNKRDLLKIINLYFQIFQIHKIRQQMPNSLSDPMNTLMPCPFIITHCSPKLFLTRPNNFGLVPIAFAGSNSFWSGPNHFEHVQIIKFSPDNSNLNLAKMIWIRPKRIGPVKNDRYLTKMIWGPIRFGQIHIILVRFKLEFYGQNFIISTCSK